MAHDDQADFELRPDSIYRITSAGSGDDPIVTTGRFLGYTGIGNEEGMAFELSDDHGDDAGRTRVVPVAAIMAIDVLQAAEAEGEEDEELGPSYT